ncbi:MAG: hypothetical protein KC657_01530, partial [Myxococcales bacterium]|nr:hypothetical protein [Myxococcales bacterium]
RASSSSLLVAERDARPAVLHDASTIPRRFCVSQLSGARLQEPGHAGPLARLTSAAHDAARDLS